MGKLTPVTVVLNCFSSLFLLYCLHLRLKSNISMMFISYSWIPDIYTSGAIGNGLAFKQMCVRIDCVCACVRER